MIQYLPSLIMFTITLIFATLCFIPITTFKQKNELIRFYWVGAWVFLALIAAFAGAAETLKMLNFEAENVSIALLSALTVCFVLFVMFGWFRLSFAAICAVANLWFKKRPSV